MILITTANEPDGADDALPELPPLDRSDDDAPMVELDQTWIAVEQPPQAEPELDEAAFDLDVGVKIDEPRSLDDDAAPQEIVLDMAELLNVVDEGSSDEVEGLEGMDPAVGIEAPPATAEDGAAEGIDEDLDYLVADRLPRLDADEEGLFEVDPAWSLDQGARDEPPPPWADARWTVIRPAPHEVRIDAPRRGAEIPGVEHVVCASTTHPAVAIVRRDTHLAIARQHLDGSFAFQALDETGRRVARGRSPMLAARSEFVCLGDEKQGIAVSVDGGQTFEAIPGCSGVTALTLADLHRTTVLLAALHHETTDATELACIDLTRLDALRIAALEAAPDDASCQVTLLIWDEEAHALLAGGDFGTASFVPPRQ